MTEDDFHSLTGDVKRKEPTNVAGHRARVRAAIDRNPDFSGYSEYEMLEYLLFAVIPRKDTKPIAKDLIQTFGSLSAVFHADYYELLRVDGVGEQAAHLLAHVLPIVMRGEYLRYDKVETLSTPQATAKYYYARFLGETKEKLLMTTLNINDEVIQTVEISYGMADSTSVDVMKILRYADRDGAKKILLAHNHPGGTMDFSDADVETTARIVTCCRLTDITMYDHLIFYGNKYLSMYGNDVLSRVFDVCENVCSQLSVNLARERTYRSLLAKLRVSGMRSDSTDFKLAALSVYRALARFDRDARERILADLVATVKE